MTCLNERRYLQIGGFISSAQARRRGGQNEKGKARVPSLQSTDLLRAARAFPTPPRAMIELVLRHLCICRRTPGEKRGDLECANTTCDT